MRRYIKTNAKYVLKGNYLLAAGTLIIALLTFALASNIIKLTEAYLCKIPDIFSLSSFSFNIIISSWYALTFLVLTLLAGMVSFGIINWYQRLALLGQTNVANVFYWFKGIKNILKTTGIYINLQVRMLLWGALFFAPAVLYTLFAIYIVSGTEVEVFNLVIIFFIDIMLILISLLIFLHFTGKYFLVPFLLNKHKTAKVSQLIRLSSVIMQDKKDDIFIFNISFLPLFFLCFLIIPAFYILPYYLTGKTIYAEYFIKLNDQTA